MEKPKHQECIRSVARQISIFQAYQSSIIHKCRKSQNKKEKEAGKTSILTIVNCAQHLEMLRIPITTQNIAFLRAVLVQEFFTLLLIWATWTGKYYKHYWRYSLKFCFTRTSSISIYFLGLLSSLGTEPAPEWMSPSENIKWLISRLCLQSKKKRIPS